MDVVIRDATAADLTAIVGLYVDDDFRSQRDTVTEPLAGSYGEAFREIDADPRQRLVVAEVGGDVIATLHLIYLRGLTSAGAERAHVASVRVASALRGRGIGGVLMRWVVEQARARGCASVELMTNVKRVDAHRFYERLGFVSSHVGMKLRLDP